MLKINCPPYDNAYQRIKRSIDDEGVYQRGGASLAIGNDPVDLLTVECGRCFGGSILEAPLQYWRHV